MAYNTGGAGQSGGWRRNDRGRQPYGKDDSAVRDRNALGNSRPSRYGLSSPTNFPPARSPRSPGGFHTDDNPRLYDNGANGHSGGRDNPPQKTAGKAPKKARSAQNRSRKEVQPDQPAANTRQEKGELDRAELERLYRIATGQKEPRFRDALREGPWAHSVLHRRGFLLCLAECALYAGCFYFLLDPLTSLTARLGALSNPTTAALVSLAGTLACMLFWPLFRDRRMLCTAWGFLTGAALFLVLLSQFLLWGEAQAQWTALRFCAFFFLGPAAANGVLSYGLLYLHWRRELPRPVLDADEEEEDDEEEEERGTVRAKPERDGRSQSDRERDGRGRNPSSLDRNGWNRNLGSRSGWDWNQAEAGRWERSQASADRVRWKQTEADRDGRRQAESVRNKWK